MTTKASNGLGNNFPEQCELGYKGTSIFNFKLDLFILTQMCKNIVSLFLKTLNAV